MNILNSEILLKQMGIYIKNINPELSIHIEGAPESNKQHMYWRELGQETFRAKTATVLLKYHSGNGKKLQQILGEALSRKRKNEYFNKNVFFTKTKFTKEIDIHTYKHHFVNAFLGYLVEHLQDVDIHSYIINHWLDNIWKNNKDLNSLSKLKLYAFKTQKLKLLFNIIKFSKNSNGSLYIGQLINQDIDEILLEVKGASHHYVNKKLLKKSIEYVKLKQYSSKPGKR